MIYCGPKLIFAVAALATVWSSGSADEILECYRCTGTAAFTEANLPGCSELKDSPEFKVQCPNSTMCIKEMHILHQLDGKKRIMERRGCARQLNERHVIIRKAWEIIHFIDEPYEVGCLERQSDNTLSLTIQQCYCRGNLCNASTDLNLNSLIKIIYVMFLLSSLRIIIAI